MVRKWSASRRTGDPLGGLEVVGRPSRRSGSGQETLPEVRKWSGDPPGGSKVVGRPFRGPELVGRHSREVRKWSGDTHERSGSGRVTLPEVRRWSEDRPGGPEVVGKPARRSVTGR